MSENEGVRRNRRAEDDTESGLWVLSDMAPDGETYIPTIQIGADRTFVPADPTAYALTLIRVAEYAAYDAAVLAQMVQVTKGDLKTGVMLMNELRDTRPPVRDADTAPMMFQPIVSAKTWKPIVMIHVDGKPFGQWSPAEAKNHAEGVLTVSAVVEMDAAYRRYLMDQIGIDAGRARNVVDDLLNYREDADKGDDD